MADIELLIRKLFKDKLDEGRTTEMKGWRTRSNINNRMLDNHQFFQILYRSYYQKLCVDASHYVKDKELARDIVQEVFLKAWLKLSPLRERVGDLWENYLTVMTRDASLNIKKRKAVEVKNSFDYCNYSNKTVINDWIIQKEYDLIFEKAVNALPVRQREIFVLKYYGFETRIISKEFKITYNTARNNLVHAVKKLEACV